MRIPRSSCLAALTLAVLLLPLLSQSQSMCNAVSNNPLVMQTLCSQPPQAQAVPATLRTSLPRQPLELQPITAEAINHMRLIEAPPIATGDVLRYEANRNDFVLELFFGNGKEIVVQPLTRADAESSETRWKKGETKLDYPETVNQQIVRMRIRALHQIDAPLLLRDVRITRSGQTIVQLQVTYTGPNQPPSEPPMSYPPDPMIPNPHMTNVSVSKADLVDHQAQTGFLTPKLPSYSMNPMMFQSTTTSTGDPNHYKFQGKELDMETDLYNFGARYYNPALSRFMSPDWSRRPAPVPYANFANPQSLNLYSFGLNNPMSMRDSDGHCPGDDCSKVKVTVTADKPGMLLNAPAADKNGNPGFVSGAGTVTTVTFTEQGKPLAGVAVTESPQTKDNLTGKTLSNTANTESKTTSPEGTIHDVVMGVITPTTAQPQNWTADDKAGMTQVVTTEPYNRSTDQTLNFSVNGQTCQCTYSESLSNVDSNGNLNKTTNSTDGTNFTFKTTKPVVAPADKKNPQ